VGWGIGEFVAQRADGGGWGRVVVVWTDRGRWWIRQNVKRAGEFQHELFPLFFCNS